VEDLQSSLERLGDHPDLIVLHIARAESEGDRTLVG